jgi:hypothetical protein
MLKIFRKSLSPVCLLIGLGAVSAWGAAISEPPDFPDSGGPVINLTLGVNSITGSVNGCQPAACAGLDYLDDFIINLPVGLKVVSASLQFSNVFVPAGQDQHGVCASDSIGCFYTNGGGGFAVSSGQTEITIESPWTLAANGSPITGSADYLFTIQTTLDTAPAPTPEPSTSLLAAVGMGAVVAYRRRKQKASA